MSASKQPTGYECPKCKNNYSTAYSMYRHMRKVHNCDVNRCVTLYCPIENCNQSYDRYNALDTHLTHVHYADIRKEQFNFTDLQDFENWLRDITSSSKTKYIKRSCNNSYRYYRCHRSGLPKTSTDKINSMKSTVKIGRHCPSRIIAKITDRSVQVEFVPTHIGHECEIAKIPLSQKKRHDIACRLASNSNNNNNTSSSNTNNNNSTSSQSTSTANNNNNNNNQTDRSTLNASSVSAASVTMQTNATHHHNHSEHDQQQHHHHQQTTPNASLPSHQNNSQMNTTTHQQPTGAQIIRNDSSLIATLGPNKGLGPDQLLAQHTNTTNQTATMQHIVSAPNQQLLTPQAAQLQQQTTSNNMTTLALQQSQGLHMTSPNRQELTGRFEQLLSSIRSDKHASIVKAQLEVCFALIRD